MEVAVVLALIVLQVTLALGMAAVIVRVAYAVSERRANRRARSGRVAAQAA